jgi:hypothetical protein
MVILSFWHLRGLQAVAGPVIHEAGGCGSIGHSERPTGRSPGNAHYARSPPEIGSPTGPSIMLADSRARTTRSHRPPPAPGGGEEEEEGLREN